MTAVFDLELNDNEKVFSDLSDSDDDDDPTEGLEEIPLDENVLNQGPVRVGPQDFELVKVIGTGGYAKVFQVRKTTGADADSYYAMKVLKKAFLVRNPKDIEHTRTERNILEAVKHPFIVELVYAFQTNGKLYLILEFLNGGDMFQLLAEKGFLEVDAARFYLAEVTLALEHLHSLGIMYRDLKPENILIDNEGHIKLTDFGLSKEQIGERTITNTFVGTLQYMAPEIIKPRLYDKTVDWWSLGVLLFDMVAGDPPFQGETKEELALNIRNCWYSKPKHLQDPNTVNLIECLLKVTPANRLGFGPEDGKAIRRHPFFDYVDWDDVLARRMEVPFLQRVKWAGDVSKFDKKFTKLPPVDSPVDVALSESANRLFEGFSYVAPCVLEDMRRVGPYNDDEITFKDEQMLNMLRMQPEPQPGPSRLMYLQHQQQTHAVVTAATTTVKSSPTSFLTITTSSGAVGPAAKVSKRGDGGSGIPVTCTITSAQQTAALAQSVTTPSRPFPPDELMEDANQDSSLPS